MKNTLLIRALVSFSLISFFSSSWGLAGSSAVSNAVLAEKLLANVSVAGAAQGSVIASPSKTNPNYYFHWTRDSALVMAAVEGLLERATPELRPRYEQILDDYAAFSRKLQFVANQSGGTGNFFEGLGDPRFNVDGTMDQHDWCRPQNDGPALRVITLTRYARYLQGEGSMEKIHALYSNDPWQSLMKADLEFVSHHWSDRNCSLWEDLHGHFFYTNLLQRRALLEGGAIALELNDPNAAGFYFSEAEKLEKVIEGYWDADAGFIVNNRPGAEGLQGRDSNLDTSVILAVIQGEGADGYFDSADDRVLATAERIRAFYAGSFSINQVAKVDSAGQVLGTAIGRYPEDTYDGHANSVANPWFLLVHAFAELDFRLATVLAKKGSVTFTSRSLGFYRQLPALGFVPALGETIQSTDPRFAGLLASVREAGDSYLRRSLYHTGAGGSMNEQFDHTTGFMTGVPELTWGYASLLTARWAR